MTFFSSCLGFEEKGKEEGYLAEVQCAEKALVEAGSGECEFTPLRNKASVSKQNGETGHIYHP